MKLLLAFLVAAATGQVCDQNSLCDNVMTCTNGLICSQLDSIGIGKCCLDTSATTPSFVTQFPIFGNTFSPLSNTQFPISGLNTINPFNPGQIPGVCQDLLNPLTGISDCHLRAQYCSDSNYFEVMSRQCPKTCGRCSAANQPFSVGTTYSFLSQTTPYSTSGCVDRVNAATGQSDCPRQVNLCYDRLYQNLMREQCPKTCGFCAANGIGYTSTVGYYQPNSQLGSGISGIGLNNNQQFGTGTRANTGSCIDVVNPRTGFSDCPSMTYLCSRSTYASFMKTQCPHTCGLC